MKANSTKSVFAVLIFCILPISMAFCSHNLVLAQETKANDKKDAVIVLSTVTIAEMKAARKLLEGNHVKITTVFPPSVFIAKISERSAAAIKEFDAIQECSFEPLNVSQFADYDLSSQSGMRFWNDYLKNKDSKESFQNALKGAPAQASEFYDDVFTRPIPKDKQEADERERRYREHWKIKKADFEKAESEKKQKWESRHGKKARVLSGTLSQEALRVPLGYDPGTVLMGAYGAREWDTSLYMAGDIAVGIVFESGTLGEFPEGEKEICFNRIVSALNQFALDEPNARIVFYPVVTEHMEVSEMVPFVNDLRNQLGTDWAYLLFVRYGGSAFAYRGGPDAYTGWFQPPNNGWTFESSVRHETMHIFFAMDQYTGFTPLFSPTERFGYLGVVNANSQYTSGSGYFNGRGEGQPDLMNPVDAFSPIGVYSRGQIGWRDSDGDGVLDPLDTFPDSQITSILRSGNSVTVTGKTIDQALINWEWEDNVTINTIAKVEYRLNGGAWKSAGTVDGAFDTAEEDFSFTLPPLKNGTYTVEVRATNSVGNQERRYARETVTITGSSVTNVKPFAGFSVFPPQGSTGTVFTFDGSPSSDLEVNTGLTYYWNFGDGITSSGKTVYHAYATAGLKTVTLTVLDPGGLKDVVRQVVEVAGTDIPPVLKFFVSPENQHGDNPNKGMDVRLDVSGSFDAEDAPGQLVVRWDFNNDGVWDTGYANIAPIIHRYQYPVDSRSAVAPISKHYKVRAELKDSRGNVNQGTRDIWFVTYNHPPSGGVLDFSDMAYGNLRVNGANDLDYATTWDGWLEYRWDFDNDGTWDTNVSRVNNQNSAGIPSRFAVLPYGTQVACEIRDRFGASRILADYWHAPVELIPTGTMSINNGAAFTKDSLVTLRFSIVQGDAGGGIQMQLSADGITWGDPEPFMNQKSWLLPSGEGAKTVYARFRNLAGKWSASISSTIIIDTTAPTAPTNLTVVDVSTGYSSIFWLRWGASTDNSGKVTYQVYRNGVLIATTSNTSYKDSAVVGCNVYSYKIRAYDVANNYSPDSNTVTVKAKCNST